MPLPTTCQTCKYWKLVGAGARAQGEVVGECRASTPIADFRWPRTKDIHGCAKHSARETVAFATGKADAIVLSEAAAAVLTKPQPGQITLLDADASGSAPNSGSAERIGGPGAAQAAPTPQSTANAPAATTTARGAGRSGQRRTLSKEGGA